MKGRTTSLSEVGELGVEFDARYRPALQRFFLRRVGSQWEAEDLTQEVFLRLVRLDKDLNMQQPAAFIFTIATNLLHDRGRRDGARRRDQHFSLEGLQEVAGGVVSEPAAELGPDRVLMGEQSLQALFEALEELPETTRHIFVLYRYEGMKQREIAEACEISLSSVEKHLSKAIVYLTRKLVDHD